jgi:DNA gyrase subunit A
MVLPGGAAAGKLVSALEVVEGEDVMVVTAGGKVHRVPVEDIPEQHRRSKGKRFVTLTPGDRVVEVTRASGRSARVPPTDPGGAGGGEAPETEPVDQMELLG